MAVGRRTTVKVSNIPLSAIAKELLDFFETVTGKDSVFACEIHTERQNWKSKGFGRVQFETLDAAEKVSLLSAKGKLFFRGTNMGISQSFTDVKDRPIEVYNRLSGCILNVGFLSRSDCFGCLETWKNVEVEIMPERKRFRFRVVEGLETYKLEIAFEYVVASSSCHLDGGKSNAVLLKLKYAPKIYRKMTRPTLGSQSSPNRYYICKENSEFLWVRTTDFSVVKSIGQSSSFVWNLKEGSIASDILTGLPHYEGELETFTLVRLKKTCFSSELVPLLRGPLASTISYECIFQLNSLVHTQKLGLSAVNSDLIEILSSLNVDFASMIFRKLQGLKSTCYEALPIVQSQLKIQGTNKKDHPSSSRSRSTRKNLMSCHRVLITPSKIYCLGPEVETSNYVVSNYMAFESDFLRVTFVEEDWSKLPADAITTSFEQGIFSKPYRTSIYHRVLSVLKDGIVIGDKRFEFLAFSASQLRSSSVWMFASNEKLKAEEIRQWMGSFNVIRSVSKCAARMGQLFSSSLQTLPVRAQHVESIPDVEVISDGVKYCFSDGIGKISRLFAEQVAEKCGLSHIPSAFQIRYGGYKGVVALGRNSFHKLSLRPSMKKFESKNIMLNITSWSEYLPCFLNRDIISLLSTLGIEDEKFEAMQHEQIRFLDDMLTKREAALNVLEGLGGGDINKILVKMLLQGYEPNYEPYLSMLLRAYHEYMLSDIRSKCRIFVPKGRVLMGCLDETGTLNYGQVYIRVTMTKTEHQSGGQTFFRKVDELTSVVVGKVVVTKNPCLHPGDIRVLEAVYEPALKGNGLIDCLVFPQKGERPHPNECSGGDLDGDLYFVSWDENLIPLSTDAPMEYIGRRPRITDHVVTLEEIQKFFVDYMINDNLGIISTAHLVHADREPEKARSSKCLELATLHSMAVDFAKTGAPAEMPSVLRPWEYPDFMERQDRPMYTSTGVLGKLYRAISNRKENQDSQSELVTRAVYDHDLEVDGFKAFLETAESHKEMYIEKFSSLMNYYGAENEEEIVTGNLRKLSLYLERDKRKYKEMKDRVLESIKSLREEAKEWFQSSCKDDDEQTKMASAWYHVTYHPDYLHVGTNFLSFPWIVGDVLMDKIKSINKTRV